MPRTGLSSEGLKEIAMQLAADAIRAQGYEKVRLAQIAKEMRISHAALYAHFADKAALLDAVTERWLRTIQQRLEDVTRERSLPKTKIRDWFILLHKLHRDRAHKDPELYRAFVAAYADHKPFVLAYRAKVSAQLGELVNEAIIKKQFRKIQAASAARILLEATLSYHDPQMVLGSLSSRSGSQLEEIIDLMLRGLAARR